MKDFVYENHVKVCFGTGGPEKYLPKLLPEECRRVMLTYGGHSLKRSGLYERLVKILREAGKEIVEFSGIMPNPTLEKEREGARIARAQQVDFILAAGGGSVLDCSKALAAQARTEEDIWEMEFCRQITAREWIPMGAVLTAAGTGSEMNNEAVITNEAEHRKESGYGCHADFVIMDPSLTLTLPPQNAMSCAFDSLSHCMETYFGKPDENILSDDMNEAVMRSIIRNMRKMKEDPEDVNVRGELMWASAMAETGILKLGKTTDFQGHQIEHQLGAYTDCSHGLGLAVILPVMYRHIWAGCPSRFARFALRVMGVPEEGRTEAELAAAGIRALEEFIREMELPLHFSEMGLDVSSYCHEIARTAHLSRGCARQLTADEMEEILRECE